jgi:hypothetical protein
MMEFCYTKAVVRLLKIALQATIHNVNVSPLVVQPQRLGARSDESLQRLHG